MSVMTTGEQRRRAGVTRGRRVVTGAPGQQAGTAGEQQPHSVMVRRRLGAQGQGTRRLTLVAPPRTSEAARPQAGGLRLAPAARPGVARPSVTRPETARPSAPRSGVMPPDTPRTVTVRARQVRTRVRLTRRGRIVIAALITAGVVLVVALAWLAGTARAEAAGSGPPPGAVYHSLHSVVVQPGESLWAIATQADPAGDPRSVIQEIIDINALHGTSVQPGQRLWLPRS